MTSPLHTVKHDPSRRKQIENSKIRLCADTFGRHLNDKHYRVRKHTIKVLITPVKLARSGHWEAHILAHNHC